MTALANKGHILEEAGYAYSGIRMIYFNPMTRKVFSVEFVEDNDASELLDRISQNTDGEGWRFYFNSPPSEAVKRELESVLG